MIKMDNIESLKQLLLDNVITKEEYDSLSRRVLEEGDNYRQNWKEMLDGFTAWGTSQYAKVTIKGYRTCLYKLMLYLTKASTNDEAFQMEFQMYTFRNVNSFLKKLEEENYSAQGLNKVKYSIVVFGKYLETLGIEVPDITTIKTSVRKYVNQSATALKHEEIMDIVESTDLRSKVCILLSYEACLRRIELVNLKVQDFNMNNKQVYIYDKDGKIDRVCILTDSTIDIIKRYINELYENIDNWNKSRVSKGRAPRDDFGYLFQSVKMVAPSYSLLQAMLKSSATNYYKSIYDDIEIVKSKVANFTFENIRNSRRVYLLSKGQSVTEVMQVSGDKNYMSTYRFVKMVPELYPESIKVID